MKWILLIILAVLAIAGCSNPEHAAALDAESDATLMLKSKLRDPGSLQLSAVHVYGHSTNKNDYAVCGYYNAKNGFGGYDGEERFIYQDGVMYPGAYGSMPEYLCRN